MDYSKIKKEIEREQEQEREQESIRNKDKALNELNIEVIQ